MRTFDTGATVSDDAGKPDYEGILSPAVLERYGAYMVEHQTQEDGQPRASDNWQKGIPRTEHLKSLLRHVVTLWRLHRQPMYYTVVRPDALARTPSTKDVEDTLCAIIFRAQGYLHEWLIANPTPYRRNGLPGDPK